MLVANGSLVMDSSGSISYGFLSQCGDGSEIHGVELSESSYGLSSYPDDVYAKLDSTKGGYKRSPVRGLLRAISSLTITDIELIEECKSQLRCNVTLPINTKHRKSSPTTTMATDSSPTFPIRSPSRKTSLKSKRGGTQGRKSRSKSQGEEVDDDEIDLSAFHAPLLDGSDHVGTSHNLSQETIDQVLPREQSIHSFPESEQGGRSKLKDLSCQPENGPRHSRRSSLDLSRGGQQEGIPQRPRRSKTEPYPEKKEGEFQQRPRRKSFDLLPSIPRRVSSVDYGHSGVLSKHGGGSVATVSKLIDSFDAKGTIRSQEHKPFYSMSLEPSRASTEGNILSHRYEEATESNPSLNGLPLFDRFKSDSDLPLLDLDLGTPSGLPAKKLSFHRNERTADGRSNRSGEDEEASPYRVREFVVSLDELEDNRVQSDKLRRRSSFDSLPTPPKRFMDSFGGSDSESDEERRTTEGRRRSFDDIWQKSPGFIQDLNDSEAHGRFLSNLDRSSRSTESQEIKKSNRSTPTSGHSRVSRRRRSSGIASVTEKALNQAQSSGNTSKSHDEAYELHDRLPFLDFSSRSNAASPVADNAFQRNRSISRSRRTADHPLARTPSTDQDQSDSSESQHNHETIYGRSPTASMVFNLDFSTRSQSVDCVPAIPRRRLPSENSVSNFSCEDTIELNDLQHTKDGEISDSTLDVPVTSRRESELAASITSKLSSVSKVSSITMSDFHDDASSLSSRKGRAHRFLDLSSTLTKRAPYGHVMNDEDQYLTFGDDVKRVGDKLPPVPIRERSNPTLIMKNSLEDEDGYTSSDEDNVADP